MQCLQCGKEFSDGNFAYLTFGMLLTPDEERRFEDVHPLLVFGWHGQVKSVKKKAPTTEMTASIEFNSDHLRHPPTLVKGQVEYYYCSTDCLRAWQNGVVDLLEERRDHQPNGQMTNQSGHTNPLV